MPLSTLWRCGGTTRTFACSDSIQWSTANPHRLTFTFCAPHSQPRCASRSRFLRSAGTQHLKDTPHISHSSSTCQAGRRGYNPGHSDQLDNRSSSIFSPNGTALLHTICLEDVSRASPDDWERLRQLQESNTALSALVISVPQGEYLCISVGRMRGVIQLDELRRDLRKADLRKAVGQSLELSVLRLDEAEGLLQLCGSSSHALLNARFTAIENSRFQEGDEVLGTVVSMTRYGVFINILPGLDGFMHISNMSSRLVKSVADLYTIGQQVEVVVMFVDLQRGQIGLGAKFDP